MATICTIRLNTGHPDGVYQTTGAEEGIDWNKDLDKARIGTIAYAAAELENHLKVLARGAEPGLKVKISGSLNDNPEGDLEILLGVKEDFAGTKSAGLVAGHSFETDQGYLIVAAEQGAKKIMLICAGGREGVLYGAYHYLTWLGFRWIHKDEPFGTLKYTGNLWKKGLKIVSEPDFKLRGFYSAGDRELVVWAARNRVNFIPLLKEDVPFMKKLGMKVQHGGHVLQEVFDPDRKMETGKTLFEEHPDWFAVRDGKRYRQTGFICLSQAPAVEYLLNLVMQDIRSKGQHLDIYSFWGPDLWGPWCECPGCLSLGNATDRHLYLTYLVRKRMDSLREGALDGRNVDLYSCAYEGSFTLQPPSKPLPADFDLKKVYIEYFPINRCYSHHLFDEKCRELNLQYKITLQDWFTGPFKNHIIVGEYYNVSQYFDMAIGFATVMDKDLKTYQKFGAYGVHYMHIPRQAWGTRTLTQWQFASQLWDSRISKEKILQEYFRRRYRGQSGTAERLYARLERTMAPVTSLYSWTETSLSGLLRRILGSPYPQKMLYDNLFPTDHFKLFQKESRKRSTEIGVGSLEEMSEGMKNSLKMVAGMLSRAKDEQVKQNLTEDRFLINYTALVVELCYQLSLFWHGLKYGGKLQAILPRVERIVTQLSALDISASGEGGLSMNAFKAIRLEAVIENLKSKMPILIKLGQKRVTDNRR